MNNVLQNQIHMNALESAKNACEGTPFPSWGWFLISGVVLAIIGSIIGFWLWSRN